MTISDFIRKSRLRIKKYGVHGVKATILEGGIDAARRIGGHIPVGTNVLSRDWDLLIVLDGCRADTLKTVINEFDIEYEWDTIWSTGSQTSEWMANTFTSEFSEVARDITVVTAHPYSEGSLDARQLGGLDEVWRVAWDDNLGTVPPRPVTEQSIHRARGTNDRVLVHYLQPHYPFIADDAPTSMDETNLLDGSKSELNDEVWWNALKYGRTDPDRVRTSYAENLRYVLNDVELLLSNVDAQTAVITADHGNSFGEFGAYGHPSGLLHPSIRRVPWVKTTGMDENTLDPTPPLSEDAIGVDTKEMLRDLGYL
jgi:hypothetical protein